jgi:pimeloyl-ACP methyl ester carboxylesterase
MATFVLVHPAWFGGWCWKKVESRLRAGGHAVYSPTLTGLGERAHLAAPFVGLSVHIRDVAEMLSFEDLDGVILVGNSSGGSVITGVADRIPERIAKVVYLDAFVPANGQATRDLIAPERREVMEALVEEEGFGWLLPRFAQAAWEQFVPEAWKVTDDEDLRWVLDRLRPTPFRHFTEPIQLACPDTELPPRVYIRCTENHHPGFDRCAEAAQSSPGWTACEIASAHLPYITDPDELTAQLVDIAE